MATSFEGANRWQSIRRQIKPYILSSSCWKARLLPILHVPLECGASSTIYIVEFPQLCGALAAQEAIMASKVWFITGTSKGFGRVWAEAALARGDRVAATARDVKSLAPLVERYGNQVSAITLDVTDKAAVGAAITEAHTRFGRLDVVINNAGYGLFGTIEEVSEAEARAHLATNLFGALWATQPPLPTIPPPASAPTIHVSPTP